MSAGMIVDPVERRVREDDVPLAAARERGDIALFEAQPGYLLAVPCRFEHSGRSIDAERFARPERGVERSSAPAGAAPEIDDAHRRRGADERQQIGERLLAFLAKFLVLRRVPGVGHGLLAARRDNPTAPVVERQPIDRCRGRFVTEVVHAHAEEPNWAAARVRFLEQARGTADEVGLVARRCR
jgi:hypothetical protein